MAATAEIEKPTIQADYDKYESDYNEAINGSVIGRVGGTLRAFLKTASTSPYYQFKANMALSGADEENEPWENLAATKFFLKKAEEALKIAKETYTHDPFDTEVLEGQTKVLQGEWEQFHQRRKEVESSDDEDDDE